MYYKFGAVHNSGDFTVITFKRRLVEKASLKCNHPFLIEHVS